MDNHNLIEKKWQNYWITNHVYKFNPFSNKPPYYVLDMFPYPSGSGLHVGHPRGYTASDIIARWKRFQGYEVIHPIGWDAFGLPSEQYAIKTNQNPKSFTKKNIDYFRNQLQNLGFSYDYSLEINTSDPKYYQWTQWIFQQLYKHSLAKTMVTKVNYCDELNTVLSNEETYLDSNNDVLSMVGHFPVVQEKRTQWVLKITAYAQKLLDGLENLNWPENIKTIQKKWIGKESGYLIPFLVQNKNYDFYCTLLNNVQKESIIYISPEHQLITNEFKNNNKDYFEKIKNMQDVHRLQKYNDVLQTDYFAFNNELKLKLPIIIKTSLLDSYANGSLIKINTDLLNQNKKNVKIIITRYKKITFYKLHDWIFSRQRFWGEPFPLYYDHDNHMYLCENLPLKLPKDKFINFADFKKSITPLENLKSWYWFKNNDIQYHHDPNVMPQWAGSSWYHIAYLWRATEIALNKTLTIYSEECKKIYAKFLPVNIYVGGKEHAVSHLMYSRFWNSFLYDIGILNSKEPFQSLKNQGMVLGFDGQKMSKSRGNVVNPNTIVDKYGADSFRCYEMFVSDFHSDFPWNDSNIKAIKKWINRIYLTFTERINSNKTNETIIRAHNDLITGCTTDFELFKFNTAISKMMIFINECFKQKIFNKKLLKNFLIIFSCICPHIAEEIYQIIYNEKISISFEKWPCIIEYDFKKQQTFKLPIQINGVYKVTLEFNIIDSKKHIINKIRINKQLGKYFDDCEIIKIIFIRLKIINFILK